MKLPSLEEVAGVARVSEVAIPSHGPQALSTQRILERKQADDLKAQARTISTTGQLTSASSIGEVDSKVQARKVSATEVELEEGLRRKGHHNTTGQSEEAAVEEAKKRAVIDAYQREE